MSKELTKTETKEEINRLKRMADILKLEYSENIGLDTLKARVDAQNANILEMASKAEITGDMSDAQKQQAQIKRASAVTRVIVTANDPSKVEYQSFRFGGGNRNGSFTKVVPAAVPWYVEKILINIIKEAKYRQPVGKKGGYRTVPSFTVTELPHLTPEEVIELRKIQDLRAEAASL